MPCIRTRHLLITVSAAAMLIAQAEAGPPFRTDDPEPVEHLHWEIYIASQLAHDRDALTGTAPHLEVNNGPLPDLQLHLIVPLAYAEPQGGAFREGLGDVELGAKYRFVQESDLVPQIGTFPLVELPTGSRSRGLGNGLAQFFFPVWLQKSWGDWTTYGGAGYWRNPGPQNRDYWFFGWEVQRSLLPGVALGVEAYHNGASTTGGSAETGVDVGAMVDFSNEHHLLFSAGRDIGGENLYSMYLAFQWTIGPTSG
jgi:hypothetical protein